MDVDTIMRRLYELEEENKRLKSLLVEHDIPFEVCAHDGNLVASQFSMLTASTVSFSLQEKVELSEVYQGIICKTNNLFQNKYFDICSFLKSCVG